MKTIRILVVALIAMVATAEFSIAQKLPGLDGSPADISYFRPNGRNSEPLAKVVYGRPQKKGRTMLGSTEPYGKVWRLGANEATEIKLYKDLTFGDKLIKAGTYSLFAIPNEKEWVIIFNSKLDQWGAYTYDEKADVARITVPASKPESEVEAFTIIFDGKDASAAMVIAWENTMVKVPVKY